MAFPRFNRLQKRLYICTTNCNARRLMTLAFSLLSSTLIVLALTSKNEKTADIFFVPSSVNHSEQSAERVFIWEPGGNCNGDFVSEPAKHGEDDAPYAMVRDAIVDRRLSTNSHFLETHPRFKKLNIPFIRIVIFMTLHMSVRGEMANATAYLTHDRLAEKNTSIVTQVDYFQQIESHLNRGSLKSYKPGMRNQKGVSLTEWQVSLSFFPDDVKEFETISKLMDHIIALSVNGWNLHIDLQLRRFDDYVIKFNPRMSLACATGWFFPESIPPQLIRPSCPRASGAVLFSGSALHGKKTREEGNFHEVGHFAARGLHGSVEFDTVAISVIPPFTISHQDYKHHRLVGDRYMPSTTAAHLERIRASVEYEFSELGLGFSSRSSVILAPVCRLGSFREERAFGGPCSKSFWNGQYMTLLILYSMLSSSFQWGASLDLDEVLLGRPTWTGLSHRFSTGKADQLFDRIVLGSESKFFTSGWINFLSSKEATRNLTKDIISKKLPQLKSLKDKSTRKNCFVHRITGKPAVRCDVGVGFTIHSVIVRKSSNKTATHKHLVTTGVSKRNSRLMTWHPRLKLHSHTTAACGYVHV